MVGTLQSCRGFAVRLIALYLGLFVPAYMQEVTAAITGSVLDPTGAAIVNADVTAKDYLRRQRDAESTIMSVKNFRQRSPKKFA